MTEKEHRLRLAEIDVEMQKARVREAKVALEEGHKRLLAEFEKEYSKLKAEYQRACLVLTRERSYVERFRTELTEGFQP